MARMTKPGFVRDGHRLPSGRWPLQVWWYESGTRHKARKGTFVTRRARNDAGDAWVAEVLSGAAVRPSTRLVNDYLDDWLALGPQAGRRPRTLADYASKLDNYIRPEIGGNALQDVEADHLDGIYASLLAKGLSASTVRKTHAIVHKALGDAKKKGLVAVNVADWATPPPQRAARANERLVWTPEQLAAFLAGIVGHQQQPILHTMAMTGLRRSEACALRWQHLDLDRGVIEVVAGLTQADGALHLDEPKTARGRRVVDLDDDTIAVLRAHRQAQIAERLLVGAGYRDDGYVFARPDGQPWRPDSIGQAYRRIVAGLELPPIALHDLRHTHASLMLASSSDVAELNVVSNRLGHATVGFTLSTYGHALPGRQSAGAERVAALVRGAVPRLSHAEDPTDLDERRTAR